MLHYLLFHFLILHYFDITSLDIELFNVECSTLHFCSNYIYLQYLLSMLQYLLLRCVNVAQNYAFSLLYHFLMLYSFQDPVFNVVPF